jgi:biotin carboxylase
VARHWKVSRVVPLEEYDIVTAAHIREHLCVAGMGSTTARLFQDKLAMRVKAHAAGIPQAEFVPLFNLEVIDEFIRRIRPPWMLKPRIGASAMGIRRIHNADEVWRAIADLDMREDFHESSSFYLLERYIPGGVYHVDSLVADGKILFASVEHYGVPPFEISHFGGVNVSHAVRHGSQEQHDLLALNKRLLNEFGFESGVTHAEFIRGPKVLELGNSISGASEFDSKNPSTSGKGRASGSEEFYFLEIAARVGGAYTADTIAAATDINLWREWASIELATNERPYKLPPVRHDYSGLAISLAREKHPCTCRYTEPEIVNRIHKPWHVGLIVRSPGYDRVIDLLASYAHRFEVDFTAVAPPEETPEQHL